MPTNDTAISTASEPANPSHKDVHDRIRSLQDHIEYQQKQENRMGRTIIDQAERMTQLRTMPDGLVKLGVWLADLEEFIRRYRSVERAMVENREQMAALAVEAIDAQEIPEQYRVVSHPTNGQKTAQDADKTRYEPICGVTNRFSLPCVRAVGHSLDEMHIDQFGKSWPDNEPFPVTHAADCSCASPQARHMSDG